MEKEELRKITFLFQGLKNKTEQKQHTLGTEHHYRV